MNIVKAVGGRYVAGLCCIVLLLTISQYHNSSILTENENSISTIEHCKRATTEDQETYHRFTFESYCIYIYDKEKLENVDDVINMAFDRNK